MAYQWHNISAEEALLKLKANRKCGLSSADVLSLQKEHGPNTLPEVKKRSLFSIFIHQFLSPLIYLLIVAAIISFTIGDKKDAIVILIVVVLNALVGAFQEGRAEQSLAALRKLSKLIAKVIRDGQEVEIEAREVVPGDILLIAAGDAVAADSRIIEAASVSAAEASLTGESVPVSKTIGPVPIDAVLADRTSMLYAGTYITSGRALAVVTSIGMQNEIGKIADITSGTKETKTRLELRVQQFGRYIVIISLIIFTLLIALGLLKGISFNNIFMIAVSQMVSLVPEGLPVSLTIALAVGVQRMAAKGTVVRRLSGVETLGSTTVICTDKTGTLTKNEMTVTEIYLAHEERKFELTGIGYRPEGVLKEKIDQIKVDIKEVANNESFNKLIEASILCNDSMIIPPDKSNHNWRIIGDPTEAALLTMAIKLGGEPEVLRNKYQRIAELPFDSEFKMMATQHKVDGESVVYIKGAPEFILNVSGSIYLSKRKGLISTEEKEKIISVSKEMASNALRVLAIGYIKNIHIDGEKRFSFFKDKVEFLGLVGEIDPPRNEVKNSVRDCVAAGIRPVMVTGDHKVTGLAIAKILGISRPGDTAVDGQELDKMNEEELLNKIDTISVFARVHPAQKLRIVEAFQKKNNVVAMTGDGVNDAPALVKADVGVAMGITGSEVAKEAAKIIITDDNFSTIVVAVAEGRLVYQNIKKLVLFLFVTSIDEVVILLLALFMNYPPPLAAVQILWINLVSEGTLTINLIMEPFEGNEMQRAPVPINEPLIDKSLLRRIPLMVIGSVISTLGWFIYRTQNGASANLVQTETFTVLVVSQWFNVLNCRSNLNSAFSMGLLRNPWLLGGLVVAILSHGLVIYWQPLASFFHTVPIESEDLIIVIGVASLVFWLEEIRKYFVRKTNRIKD